MADLSLLIPILFVVRIALDFIAIADRKTSYQLEFGYFAVFGIMAVVVLIGDVGSGWGWLAAAIAGYSLVMFFLKRAKRPRHDAESAT